MQHACRPTRVEFGKALAGSDQRVVALCPCPAKQRLEGGRRPRRLPVRVACRTDSLPRRGGRPCGQQSQQVQRPARLRARARQAIAPEGLHTHYRAHHVAVDVQVAHLEAPRDARNGLVDARVHAPGQAVAGGVDLVDQRIQPGAVIAQHVQHRAKDFALQLIQPVDLDQRRGDEGAVHLRLGQPARGLVHGVAAGAQGVDVALDAGLRGGVDHRADVGGQRRRVADGRLVHGAFQHGDDAVGHVGLQAQHAQGRAALPGRVEGGRHHVLHHLLGQRGRIDDERVLPAGLGDQRHRLAVGVQALGQRGLDVARDLGGAGEQHAARARIGHQRRAHGRAIARQQLQRTVRHAGGVQVAHGLGGNQRRLLGRLGQHHVAGGQRGGDLAGEDGEREVPRTDARHGAQRHVRGVVELSTHLRGIKAQEVDGFAHLRHGIGPGLAGFAHQQAHEARHVGLQRVGRAFERGGARGRWRGGPGGGGGFGNRQRVLDIRDGGGAHVADDVAPVGGVADGGCSLAQLGRGLG